MANAGEPGLPHLTPSGDAVLSPAPGWWDQTGHRTWAPASNKPLPFPRREGAMPRGPASCPQSRGRLPVGYTPIWPGGAPEARRETPGSSAPSVTEQVRDDSENWQPRRSKSHESTPLGATLRRASLPPAPRSPASAGGARALCAATSDPGLGGVCRHRKCAASLLWTSKRVSPARREAPAGPVPSEAPGENVLPAFSSFWGRPHSLADGPVLRPQRQKPRARASSLTPTQG